MSKTGHCLCGQVSFKVNGEPIRMAQCHCEDCRRITGTGHVVNAFFKRSDVTIKGETKFYELIAESGNVRHRHFCPNCGSRLYSTGPNNPDILGIAVGAFDESSWFKPQVIFYHSQMQAWDVIDNEIPVKEKL